jgi:hypothetical protein
MTRRTVHHVVVEAAKAAGIEFPGASTHAPPRYRLLSGERWSGYARHPNVPQAQEHPARREVYRINIGPV